MRVLVCGGRDFANGSKVFEVLDSMDNSIDCIIQGGAQGADAFAREWAKIRCRKLVTYFADWGTHKNAAGPIRNQFMLDDGCPELIVAFKGGKGTADMVKRAKDEGITVMEIV